MENDKISIDVLIRQLNRPLFLLSASYRSAIKDDGYILNRYKKDSVNEHVLILFLSKSIFFRTLRVLVPDILYYINERSITDKVFDFCCRYPGEFRNTLLNTLAHMWLTEKQLFKLTRRVDAPEAFCKLLVLYLGNDDVSSDEFIDFLDEHRRYLEKCNVDVSCIDNNSSVFTQKVHALNCVSNCFPGYRNQMS